MLNTFLHNTLFLVEELSYLFYVLLLCAPFSLVFSLFLALFLFLVCVTSLFLSYHVLASALLFFPLLSSSLCSFSSHLLFSFRLVSSFPLLVFLLFFPPHLVFCPLLSFTPPPPPNRRHGFLHHHSAWISKTIKSPSHVDSPPPTGPDFHKF